MKKLYIAVDIGATYTRIALGNREGILDKKVIRTPSTGESIVVAKRIYEEIMSSYREYIDRIEAVGIGTIGPIDIRRGVVVNTPNLPIRTFPLREPLMNWLGKPVYVMNDAVTAVYGEKMYGLGKNYHNILYVTMSTGIGGGVIVDDHLLIGKMGNAHEIGHIVVDYEGRVPCGCGGRGHWEAYAGGANIPVMARILASEKPVIESEAYRLAVRGELDPPTLFKLYRSGDLFAKKIVSKIIEASIAGLATAINLYDPEIVTIGGSVFLNNKDILLEPLRNGVKKHLVTEPPRIEATPLGGDIVLYGALALAINPPEELLKIQM